MAENETHPKPPNRLAEAGGYKDKTIFITGGTGFLGKVLVEKLLRTCPQLETIYLLLRAKKGKSPQERVKEMFTSPLYDLLKQTRGEEIIKKVVAVPGDISEPGLGLSKENRQLLADSVQVVFHLAATIRFDEPLKKAVLINTRGTKLMLDLAKECSNLLVFCHVSTAYCHLHERVLYEKAYPPPTDPQRLLKIVEWMDEKAIDAITPMLLENCPNTYSFTKALGESLVVDEMDNLPVVIMRPSVVIPIWMEPLPGWTDNINGPAGILIGAGKGIIRSNYINSKAYADFVPVDIAVNVLMLAGYDYMLYKERRIYNCTTSFEIKITWEQIIELGRNIINEKMPFNNVVWYPGGTMTRSFLYHRVRVVLFHYIPAVILDAIIFLSGNKPVLWKIQRRIDKGFEIFSYYVNNQWDFNNDSSLLARSLMNETEKAIYKVDEKGLDIEDYFYRCIHAVRLYILKEGDETLPAARRHMKIMWVVDKVCKGLLTIWFGYLILEYVVFPMLNASS